MKKISMITVAEASQIILGSPYKPETVTCHINDAVGKVIAEKIQADRDFPPFDRITMDGIAISFDQLQQGRREFTIEDIQPAGVPQKKLNDHTKCFEVMTGAITPVGVDLVIPYEEVIVSDGKARLISEDWRRFQNIHKRGADVGQGETLIEPGNILSPAEIAVLATVGREQVRIKTLPKVSIISTGDELVEINQTPEPHQIRRSNSYALYAALQELGIQASLHHVADEESVIEESLEKILNASEAMILSGGVSKGKFDFVPKVLDKLGVKKSFHRVSQRPGKPFWFGMSGDGKAVFAFPGNPVSTFMCFYKYFKPWLLNSLGVMVEKQNAVLANDFSFQPELTYFLQVKVRMDNGKLLAYPRAGGGSGDFANLNDVDGFLELPAEQSEFIAGEVFPYIGFRKLL